MDLTIFTVEEENLICIFDTSSRVALLNDIREALPEFDEPEICEIAENVIKILDDMTDAEFYELIFSPAYHNDDDTEV
jgi:hypothetical protein